MMHQEEVAEVPTKNLKAVPDDENGSPGERKFQRWYLDIPLTGDQALEDIRNEQVAIKRVEKEKMVHQGEVAGVTAKKLKAVPDDENGSPRAGERRFQRLFLDIPLTGDQALEHIRNEQVAIRREVFYMGQRLDTIVQENERARRENLTSVNQTQERINAHMQQMSEQSQAILEQMRLLSSRQTSPRRTNGTRSPNRGYTDLSSRETSLKRHIGTSKDNFGTASGSEYRDSSDEDHAFEPRNIEAKRRRTDK